MEILKRREKKVFGYYEDKVVAVDYALALTLFANGSDIYMLYNDNTEKLAKNVDALIEHDGLYGVLVG